MRAAIMTSVAAALSLAAGAALAAVELNPMDILPGLWRSDSLDKETRVSETTSIEFARDGSYVAQLQLSPFRFERVRSGGRYLAKALDGQSFMLSIQRKAEDPDLEPDERSDSDRITVIDAQTLRASDGALLRRVK